MVVPGQLVESVVADCHAEEAEAGLVAAVDEGEGAGYDGADADACEETLAVVWDVVMRDALPFNADTAHSRLEPTPKASPATTTCWPPRTLARNSG